MSRGRCVLLRVEGVVRFGDALDMVTFVHGLLEDHDFSNVEIIY